MNNNNKLEKLQSAFPKLTEANQQYVLGLAEGLKRAQKSRAGEQPKTGKAGLWEQMGEYVVKS